MNNIKKKTQTILFASLIVAMILPFSGMGLAEAASNQNTAKDVKTLEQSLKSSNWAQVLMTTDEYQSLTNDDKITYLDFVKLVLDDSDPYQKEVMFKIDQLSQAQFHIDSSEDDHDVSIEKNRKSLLIEQLEDLGVVSGDKFDENPEYWMEKVREAKELRGSYDVKRVSGESSDSDYILVHTGDVSIRREANTFYPCFPGNPPLICSTSGMAWGTGTSSSWSLVLVNGNGATNVYGCLENDVSHTTVSWYMSGYAKHIFNIGTTDWHKVYSNTQKTVSGTNNNCVGWVETDNVFALDRLEASTTVNNPITVTGTHA